MYYKIVLIIAIISLVVALTIVGISLKSGNNQKTFPDYQNVCPDYWRSVGDNCYPVVSRSSVNIPSPDKFSGESPLINHLGVELNNTKTQITKINISDANWTGWCDKSSWAKNNGIFWDGVVNSNQCQ